MEMWNGSVAMQALDWDVSANISCLQCGSSTKTGILVFFFLSAKVLQERDILPCQGASTEHVQGQRNPFMRTHFLTAFACLGNIYALLYRPRKCSLTIEIEMEEEDP
ncbi:uncharacterized protein LOC106866445 [Brachypodium distachyon]|uniref:uncharacterized protein LOC106866445 n=1 Tax=Brachypodium distachyon TaxID=15368 RepID=UPI00071DBCA2|nr:uncharacterized protein LOC106866445 [Brachypodium distachyon]|eukprot:XP_014756158.1 uncharacterized protein LOC106866445 [Brachypodium distachyon]